MNALYFPTGDSQKDSGLKIESMLDTGAACSIINCRTFPEIAQFRQPITLVRNLHRSLSKQKTETYTGDIVPMSGHTTLSFSFDSDGEHQFELRIWITESQTSNLLGIEFCRQYVSKLLFEIPAIELKNTANAICYGNICVQQNPTPSSQGYTLSEYLIRFILTPRLPEIGNTPQRTNQRISLQELPLFLIDTPSNQD